MSVVIDSYSSGSFDSSTLTGNSTWRAGQSFHVTTAAKLTSASFRLRRYGNPGGTTRALLYAHSGTFGSNSSSRGALIQTSSSITQSTISTSSSPPDTTFTFDGTYTLQAGVNYIIMAELQSSDFSNFMGILKDFTTPVHSGCAFYDDFSGQGPNSSGDTLFSVSGNPQPVASFIASPTTVVIGGTVMFTDTSTFSPTSWLWKFGLLSTSTAQNPTYAFGVAGNYVVTLEATNAYGMTSAQQTISVYAPISPDSLGVLAPAIESPSIEVTPPPPLPDVDWSALGKEDEKVYVYRVYSVSGTYIGAWKDVADDLQFSQRLNTAGTTTTIQLARSVNTRQEVRNSRITESGDVRITEDGSTRTTATEVTSTVGEGTDVELNYRVDIYVHYGEFDTRITESGDVRITEDDDVRVTISGAPLGRRIFSGYILDYESDYSADKNGVTVTLASNGSELSQEIIRSGTTTTVTYTTTAIETGVKSIIDTNPGRMSYSSESIDPTGVSLTQTFRLNTKLEGIQDYYDKTPAGFYWYGNVSDNYIYLKQIANIAEHVFLLGVHIKSLQVKRSIENLVNVVYFVGGETTQGDPTTTVYKKYEDAPSQTAWRKGIERIVDRRYKVTANMALRANKSITRYKDPIFTSPLVISSAKYDIESIRLGQTVGFGNFGNFIDDLPPLQIVSMQYTPTQVTLELGELQDRQADLINNVTDDLSNEQYADIPNAPS